jgi:hypothetical protein
MSCLVTFRQCVSKMIETEKEKVSERFGQRKIER